MRKPQWTMEKIKTGLGLFYSEHGRYPTATEVDSCTYLPSSRQIQRNFGGMVFLRQQLGLRHEDFTKGRHGSERARKIYKRSRVIKKEAYDFLIEEFGEQAVHRDHLFTDDSRTKADFFVARQTNPFLLKVFYPKDRRSLIGCLNSRIVPPISKAVIPLIFLMMNKELPEEVVAGVLSNKKQKMPLGQLVLTFKQFRAFCQE